MNKKLLSSATAGLTGKARAIFEQMKDLGFRPTIYSYNLLIKACYTARKPTLSDEVYQWIVSDDVTPDHYTFNSLLHCCALMEDFEKATRYLSIMKECGLTPDRYTANNWVDVAIRTNHLSAAKEQFVRMGLKVKIRQKTFCCIDYEAIDCHGFSRGAACTAISIYLDNKPEVKKFQVITGAGMHCEKIGEMREYVLNYLEKTYPEVVVTPHPTNYGFLWVERS